MSNLQDLIKKYESNTAKSGWIKLQNDGDTVSVRPLDSDDKSLEVYEVHKIEIDGFQKPVRCLGEGCPACLSGNKPQLRIWLSFYNLETEQVELWERGINDIKLILGIIGENGNLNERDYRIRRNGKKGSTSTTYQWFHKDKETRDNLPDKPKINDWVIANLTVEDMTKALEGRFTFKKTDDKVESSGGGGEEVF